MHIQADMWRTQDIKSFESFADDISHRIIFTLTANASKGEFADEALNRIIRSFNRELFSQDWSGIQTHIGIKREAYLLHLFDQAIEAWKSCYE